MRILALFCGFYLFGLLIALALTTARQAVVSGLATIVAAAVAGLTLWLITAAGWTEPWLSIAMTGTIVLPAGLIGTGLLAGGCSRTTRYKRLAGSFAALLPVIAILIPFIA